MELFQRSNFSFYFLKYTKKIFELERVPYFSYHFKASEFINQRAFEYLIENKYVYYKQKYRDREIEIFAQNRYFGQKQKFFHK